MSANPDSWIRLHSDTFSAWIDPQGAQLSVLRDALGRDLLWHGDPAFWTGRAPILFPIVGALSEGQYRWRGRRYSLPRHGFARNSRFEVTKPGDQAARFELVQDADTLKVYPFEFRLEVVFSIAGPAFEVEATVHNTGKVPLPASLGFHPAFRWPLPGTTAARDLHYIEFDQDETAPIHRLDAQGLQAGNSSPTPVQARRLALSDALFDEDVAIFEQPLSRSLIYGASTGPRLRLSFGPISHLGIWSKPGAGFVCIEPWRGVADPAGFTGELDAKPGVLMVPPGGSEALAMRIECAGTTTPGGPH